MRKNMTAVSYTHLDVYKRQQWYAATDSRNRFAQNLIVELRSLMVRVIIDRSVCSNTEVLCRFNCVNICAEE